jgi:hypothetical protein
MSLHPVTLGMIANPGRTHWKAEHVKYLDELTDGARDVADEPTACYFRLQGKHRSLAQALSGNREIERLAPL